MGIQYVFISIQTLSHSNHISFASIFCPWKQKLKDILNNLQEVSWLLLPRINENCSQSKLEKGETKWRYNLHCLNDELYFPFVPCLF